MKEIADLVSVSKNPEKSVYGFVKNQKIAWAFVNMFLDFGFDKKSKEIKWFLCVDEDDDIDRKGYRFAEVEKIRDRVYSIKNDIYDIDVFFGEKRVLLVVRTKEDLQVEISNIINKHSEFLDD